LLLFDALGTDEQFACSWSFPTDFQLIDSSFPLITPFFPTGTTEAHCVLMVLYSNSKDDDFLDEILVDDYVVPPPPSQPQEPPPSSRIVAKSFASALTSTVTEQKEVELALPSTRTDPFAKREGKTLTWTNVNMTLTGKRGKDEPDRQLLKDVWGEVPVTKTTAIMGPSGAGYVRGDGDPYYDCYDVLVLID
jgi:hypothetical protein